MKNTVLLIGIMALIISFFQLSLGAWGGSFFEESLIFYGATIGRIMGILIGATAILARYRNYASLIIFAALGIAGIVIGLVFSYYEVIFWSAISLLLAGLCYSMHLQYESESI